MAEKREISVPPPSLEVRALAKAYWEKVPGIPKEALEKLVEKGIAPIAGGGHPDQITGSLERVSSVRVRNKAKRLGEELDQAILIRDDVDKARLTDELTKLKNRHPELDEFYTLKLREAGGAVRVGEWDREVGGVPAKPGESSKLEKERKETPEVPTPEAAAETDRPKSAAVPKEGTRVEKAKRAVERAVRGVIHGLPPTDALEVKSEFDGQTYRYDPETGEIWDEEGNKAIGRDIYRWTHINSVKEIEKEVQRELDDLVLGGRPRYNNKVLSGRMDVMLARAREIVETHRAQWEKETQPQKKDQFESNYNESRKDYEDLRKEYFAVRYHLMWWYEGVLSHREGFGKGFSEGVTMGTENEAALMQWLLTSRRAKGVLEGVGTPTLILNIGEEQDPNVILGKMLRLGTALACKDGPATRVRKVQLTTREGEEAIILFNPNEPGFKDSEGDAKIGMTWLYELYRTHNFDAYLLGYLKTRHKNLAFAFENVGFNEKGKPVYIFHATDTWFHAYNMWQMVEMAPFWAAQLEKMYSEANIEKDGVFKKVLTQMGWDFDEKKDTNIQKLKGTDNKNQVIIDNLIYCRFGELRGEHWQKLDMSKFRKIGTDAPLNTHATYEGYMMQTREPLRKIMCGSDLEENLKKLNDSNDCWKHIREEWWGVKLREQDFWDRAFSMPTLRALESARGRGHRDQVATFFKQRIREGFARTILRRLEFSACGIKTELGAPFVDWSEGAIMMEDYHVARQTLQVVNELEIIDTVLKKKGVELEDFTTYAGLKIKDFKIYNMAFNLRKMKSPDIIAGNEKTREYWEEYNLIPPREREDWVKLNPDKAELLFEHHPSFECKEVDKKLWEQYKRMTLERREAWLDYRDSKGRPHPEIGKIFQVCTEFELLGENDQDTLRLANDWARKNNEVAFRIQTMMENFPSGVTFAKEERGKLETRAWVYYWESLAHEYEDNPKNPRTDYGPAYNEWEEYKRVAWRAERARYGMDLRDEVEKKHMWLVQPDGTSKRDWDPRDKIVGRFIRDQIDFDPETLNIRIWKQENRSYMVSEEEKFLTSEERLLSKAQRKILLEQRIDTKPFVPPDILNELQLVREKERLGLNPVDTNLYGTGPYLPSFDIENSILYTDWADSVIVPRYFVRGSPDFLWEYAENRARERTRDEGIRISREEIWKYEHLDRRVQTPPKRFEILYALRQVGTLDKNRAEALMIRFGCTEEQANFFKERQGSWGVEDREGKPTGFVSPEITEGVNEARATLETAAGFKIPLVGIVLSPKTWTEVKVTARNLAGPPAIYLLASTTRFALNGFVAEAVPALNGLLISAGVGTALAFLGKPRGERVRSWKYFGGKILGTLGAIEQARSYEQMVVSTYGGGTINYYRQHPIRRIPFLVRSGLSYLQHLGGIFWTSDDDDPAEKIAQAIDAQKTVYGGEGRKG